MALSIQKCNTIEDIVDYGKSLDISHDKLHYKTKIADSSGNTVIVNYSSIIDKYYDFLTKIIIDVTLTDDEFAKYKYMPKSLSFDFYGTTELWSAILKINNLTSCAQFTLKKLKLFTKDIFDLLNEILILEEDELKQNRSDVGI